MSKFSYQKAQEEISQILDDLENNRIGIDQLKSKVERAIVLIEKCKGKLHETEDILQKLEDSAT